MLLLLYEEVLFQGCLLWRTTICGDSGLVLRARLSVWGVGLFDM